MKKNWRKVVSALLTLIMLLGIFQGTGIKVSANDNPGIALEPTVTVNASVNGMEMDEETGCRIWVTLNALVGKDSKNVYITPEEDYVFYLSKDKEATESAYDFKFAVGAESYILYRGAAWSVNTFKGELDCSEVISDDVFFDIDPYQKIYFQTYSEVYFDMNCSGNDASAAYFSRDCLGFEYTDEDTDPVSDIPLYVPYNDTLTQALDGSFECFPEITWEGHTANGWYLEEGTSSNPTLTEVSKDNTVFTKPSYTLVMLWDQPEPEPEHVHTYPDSTEVEDPNVSWHWNGSSENNYAGTYVEIFCTDDKCPNREESKVTIQNTENNQHNIVINNNEGETGKTCEDDGQLVYTATATYGGKTYVSTKTLDDKASGHIWEFDTSDENAEWTEKSGGGFSKVTVKKTCISDYHDEEKDGARERSVESTNITEEKVPSTICGKPDIITYTATFTNIEDSAITNPFTVTKVVEGDPLKHDWVVDTNADHVSWLGTDTAGYTKATITKTCQNAGHSGEGDTASAIKITVDVQKTATEATACEEGDVTHYTAVFTSKDDPAITENLTFTKDVTSDPHPHEWTFETSEDKVTWTGNDTDGYTKATITKTCQSKYHDVTKNGSATVSVTVDVVKTTTAAEACGEPAKIHYTAVFDSNVDPAITTPLTFEKVVDSDVLQHDWVLKTDGENVVWIGSDADGYTEVLITKTCKNEQHDETRNGAKNVLLSSKNITVSTVTACGKPDETHYVASFDSTIDPLITEAFTVEKVVKGTTVREHEWKFDTDPEHVTWVGNDEDGYTRAIIKKQCLSQYHNEQVNGPREVSVSVKPTMSYDEDVACGETTQIIYTAVFDSMVDPALTETLIFEKTVEGIALPHDWVFDTDPEDAVWTGSDEEGYTKVTVKKTCKNPKHDEEISGPAEVSVSAEVKVSTTPAEKCKEPSKIHYTAVFDETVDPDIGKAFTLEKIVDGPVLEHDWNYDVDPDHVIWGASAAETYILRTCLNGEVKHGSDNSERWAAASLTVNVTDGSCNSAYTKTMTAVFKDENGNEFFTTTKTETAAECHTFKISASNPLWHWNIGNGTETYYTGADCVFTCSAGNHKVTVPAVVVRNVAGDTVVYNAKVQVSYYDENGLFFYNEEFTDTRYTRLNSEGKEVSPYSGATESGKTISEPEDDVSHNLFYTDCDITIPLPEGADPSKGSGKWTAYYKVDSDGTVTLLKTSKDDVKKGASAGNSLIVMPICDAEGNTIGEFEYQLPVFYQKPALKLSSKSGVVNTALPDPMSLSTIVLEKKSTGVYEALDLSSIDTSSLWTGKSETAPTISLGDKAGELLITTGQKMSGKLCIRLKNWRETIELKYSVKASNKSVLSGSVNKLYMNTHFFEKGEAETCYITINGREVTSEDNISVTFPKNWESSGIDIEGIEGGILTQSELSFCYRTDQEPKKGSFTFTFKSPDGEKFKLKLTISNKELDKAVSLKVYTKMNITTGQKLVLIPNLTNCGGHIEAVTIDNDNYVIEYIEELNEILVDVAEGKSVSAGVFTPTITLSINGYDCPVAVKTKIAVTSPAVKISKVNLPKDSAAAGTAEGEASIRATIKSGGKIFEIRPEDVIFPNASLYNEEGWYAVNGVIVKWNQEEGTISVRTPGDGQKISSVKVELYFKGKTVKKILTLKVK